MKTDLTGALAVVTGAADGIGRAIAHALWQDGANIAAVDIKPVDPALVCTTPGIAGQAFGAFRCDASKPDQIAAACAAITQAMGPAAILVNNVGGGGSDPDNDVATQTDAEWDFVVSVTLSAAMRFCRGLVPGMRARRKGRIVNISSSLKGGVFGKVGTVRGRLPYVTSKMGLIGLTGQLANDLGPDGITVNTVCPGLTLPGPDARITQRFMAMPEDERARFYAQTPLGRLATGEDIASAVQFLVSDAAGFVTGETLTVAGGALR